MNVPPSMGVFQSFQGVTNQTNGPTDLQRAVATEGPHSIGTLDKFHHKIEIPIRFIHRVKTDDIGMAQIREHSSFPQETLDFLIGPRCRFDGLNCQLGAIAHTSAQIDHPHATSSEFTEQIKPGDRRHFGRPAVSSCVGCACR